MASLMRRFWIAVLLAAGCSKASPAARELEKQFGELEKAMSQIEKEMRPLEDRYFEASRRKDEGEKERIGREAELIAERLGPLMTKQQDLVKAILERSETALKQNADDADVLDVRTRVIEGYELSPARGPAGRSGEVLTDFLKQTERLLKLRPDDRSVLTRHAGALRMAGRYAEAREKLAKALKADPGDVRALIQDGLAAFCLDEYDVSVRELESATANPDAAPHFLRREAKLTLASARERRAHWEKELALRRRDEAAPLPRVKLVTPRGEILVELFEDDAPNTVANFVSLADSRFYDGTRFHFVAPGAVAYGGDPNSRDGDPETYGQGGPGYTIKDELEEGRYRRHFRGSISLLRTEVPDSGGSQFVIALRPLEPLDGRCTVFGRVISGMDAVDRLETGDVVTQMTVLKRRDHPYRPIIGK